MVPSSFKILINFKLFHFPQLKSLGSWAGVILTAPVPKSLSTNLSSIITSINQSYIKGCINYLPINFLYLSSVECTATATSPSIVSILAVDTTISS